MGVDWFACEACRRVIPDSGPYATCCVCQDQFCMRCADQFRLIPAADNEEFSRSVDLQSFDYGACPPAAVVYVCPKCEGVDFGEPHENELKVMLDTLLQRFNRRRKTKLTAAK